MIQFDDQQKIHCENPFNFPLCEVQVLLCIRYNHLATYVHRKIFSNNMASMKLVVPLNLGNSILTPQRSIVNKQQTEIWKTQQYYQATHSTSIS